MEKKSTNAWNNYTKANKNKFTAAQRKENWKKMTKAEKNEYAGPATEKQNINIRCCLAKFSNYVKEFNLQSCVELEDSPFRFLLKLKGYELHTGLIKELASGFDLEEKSLTVDGKKHKLTLKDFDYILKIGDKDLTETTDHGPSTGFDSKRFLMKRGSEELVCMKFVTAILKRKDNVDDFKRAFTLLCLRYIVCVPSRGKLGKTHLKLVENVDDLKNQPWARLAMDSLVKGINTFKNPKGTGRRDLGGSMVFLQLYYLNKLTNKEPEELIKKGTKSSVYFDEIPEAKDVPPQNYEKEEVDAFELLEESPSPQHKSWVMVTKDRVPESHLSSVLKKWLITLKQNNISAPSPSLSRILETPAQSHNSIYNGVLDFTSLKTSGANTGPNVSQSKYNSGVVGSNNRTDIIETVDENDSEDVEFVIRNLSVSSRVFLDDQPWDPQLALLSVCGQSSPAAFSDVLSEYCDLQSIAKVGEGTYGEVFIAGVTVCKVVPFDGDSLVNGEIQKKAEELLEEVMLSLTLNQLRGDDNHINNVCPTFIQTLSLRVCDGTYDDAMIRAWEEWDKKHISENDHPNEFAEKQCFVVFVQEYGGKDLESFVLLSFDEARSLLVQVTVALAVAEAAFEFEHRDLHWGNILLNRKGSDTLQFIVDGKKMHVKTYGLVASIIDFTVSRINIGEDILFLDLSLDPELFEGPKGDKQSETYRKMKDVTEDCWEGSFLKTNVLWLQYLVDILLLKKVYDRTSKDERELRSLKKRLNGYESAKESMIDPFFSDLIC